MCHRHHRVIFDEAQADKEKSNEMTRGADEALNIFFDSVEMGALEDYYGFGQLGIPRKDLSLRAGEPSSSSKL